MDGFPELNIAAIGPTAAITSKSCALIPLVRTPSNNLAVTTNAAQLKEQVLQRFQKELTKFEEATKEAVDAKLQVQQRLRVAAEEISSVHAKLLHYSTRLSEAIPVLTSCTEDLSEITKKFDGQAEIVVDNILVTEDTLRQQLLEQQSEDAALSEVMYLLSQALHNHAISFDTFVKVIGDTARKQFYRRALAQKIQLSLQQASWRSATSPTRNHFVPGSQVSCSGLSGCCDRTGLLSPYVPLRLSETSTIAPSSPLTSPLLRSLPTITSANSSLPASSMEPVSSKASENSESSRAVGSSSAPGMTTLYPSVLSLLQPPRKEI